VSNDSNRQGFLFVACDGEEIVGFVSGGRSRGNDAGFEGEVTGLFIRPEPSFLTQMIKCRWYL